MFSSLHFKKQFFKEIPRLFAHPVSGVDDDELDLHRLLKVQNGN